jgi:hypothetical protein
MSVERKLAPPAPTIEQTTAAPELALLAVLEATLDVAVVALAAAWPELHCLDLEPDCPASRTAFEIVERAHHLAAAINRYRLALASAERRRYDDLPF